MCINLYRVSVFAGTGTYFAQHLFPTIVRVDGSDANNTLDIDGLPSPVRIHAADAAGNTLSHANCQQCVQARLMQCGDAATSNLPYPACNSEAQARCATSSGSNASKCRASGDYLDTLQGTTTADLINGTAVFTNLQLQHVVGAGYKLKFTVCDPK